MREIGRVDEAAPACRERSPDLVLLDLRRTRTRPSTWLRELAPSPVVVLGTAARVERALAAGAADAIVPPLRPKLLAHRLRRALEPLRVETAPAPMPARAEEPDVVGRDGLTGLLHGAAVLDRIAVALGAARPAREPVAVLFVDLEIGRVPRLAADARARDEAIVALAERMRDSVRDRDAVSRLEPHAPQPSLARIGGEEFCILLPGLSKAQDAARVASRIQETIARPISVDGRRASISSTWGIAVSPADGEEAATLLAAARAACRSARQDDPGGIRFFTAEVDAAAAERRAIESGLALALERNELLVHYQPRVELASGRICGFEALVRWRHPELGLVPPGKFIPIAEENGLIVPIGERVLRTACAQNRAWQAQGLPHVRMGVNLSSAQFRDAELPATVAGVLRDTALSPEWLELELTESVLLQKADATVARLHRLRDMGLHLSIDDFGTGYSSLSDLKRFPIDALKIDQSFIREVTVDPGDAAITTSIVLMGKSLGLTVVAEGVETRSQLEFLRALECDEAQGYLFSRPVPAREAGELVAGPMARSGS